MSTLLSLNKPSIPQNNGKHFFWMNCHPGINENWITNCGTGKHMTKTRNYQSNAKQQRLTLPTCVSLLQAAAIHWNGIYACCARHGMCLSFDGAMNAHVMCLSRFHWFHFSIGSFHAFGHAVALTCSRAQRACVVIGIICGVRPSSNGRTDMFECQHFYFNAVAK